MTDTSSNTDKFPFKEISDDIYDLASQLDDLSGQAQGIVDEIKNGDDYGFVVGDIGQAVTALEKLAASLAPMQLDDEDEDEFEDDEFEAVENRPSNEA